MSSFKDFIFEADFIESSKIEEYLIDFFVPNNYNNYSIPQEANDEERNSIYEMFHGEDDLLLRTSRVLDNDPLCLEANYVNFRLNEETLVDVWFNNLFLKENDYKDFTPYGKMEYLGILEIYAKFLADIHNITFAIKIIKKVVALEGHYTNNTIAKLSYLYSLIEDKNGFYDLYINEEFNEPSPYLLLIVVLLKHEDEIKAKEVLSSFLSKFEYGDYIDHIWDIENNESKEALEMKDAIEICFEELMSVPYFFSWCSENKKKTLRS